MGVAPRLAEERRGLMYRIRCFHRVRQSIALVVVLLALLVVTTPVGAMPATDGEQGPAMDINGMVWTPGLMPLLGATPATRGEQGPAMDINGVRIRVR